MRKLSRAIPALLAIAWLGAGCGEPPPGAPVEPRALWLPAASPIRVGDVAHLERLVATPPGWSVSPLVPPTAHEGFWLLDAEALATERLPARWIHRTRLRIRAREAGRFTWPASTVEIEAPGGGKRRLDLAAVELDVVSVLPEAPNRLTPYGVRPLPETSTRSLLAAAAAGATGALGALAIALLVVRRHRTRSSVPREAIAGEPVEVRARARLSHAREALEDDPARAAHAISAALRHFVFERFGVPALARTSEELAATSAPLALATRWAGLVKLLLALDGARFAAQAHTASEAQRLTLLLEQAEAFVAESLPSVAPE